MKCLIVTMSDNTTWAIPASLVAHNRAAYYADPVPFEEYDATYHQEYTYAMNNEFELVDWASNSMDWAEVQDAARLVAVDTAATPYAREWTSAPKHLGEIDIYTDLDNE